MLPDLDSLGSVLALLALALLLVPKREWRGLPARLRATARGERHYLFGPPAGRGELSPDLIERYLQLLRRELPRALELGIPLHTIATFAEARGAQRRRAREEAWKNSAAGPLHEHLCGRQTEAELHDELRSRRLPLPAPKLRFTAPRKMLMPPMRWRLEWERELESLRSQTQGTPAAAQVTSRALEPVTAELEIRTLGEIRLCADGEDFAPRLLHRPALAFTWLYLLARQARRAKDRITRAVLADELFRGPDPEQQRRKLRQRLNELTRELPEPLARRIKAEGEYVWLDLGDCRFDVRRLLEQAESVRAADDPLSGEVLDEVERALRLAGEEFLPGWEEIERRATDARSGAGAVIIEVRDQVVAAHLGLVDALAAGARRAGAPAGGRLRTERPVATCRSPARGVRARCRLVTGRRGRCARPPSRLEHGALLRHQCGRASTPCGSLGRTRSHSPLTM